VLFTGCLFWLARFLSILMFEIMSDILLNLETFADGIQCSDLISTLELVSVFWQLKLMSLLPIHFSERSIFRELFPSFDLSAVLLTLLSSLVKNYDCWFSRQITVPLLPSWIQLLLVQLVRLRWYAPPFSTSPLLHWHLKVLRRKICKVCLLHLLLRKSHRLLSQNFLNALLGEATSHNPRH